MGIVHQVAGLHSLYNTILDRASKMFHSAVNSPSTLITDVFSQSAHLVYTATGLDAVYGHSIIGNCICSSCENEPIS